MKTTHKLLLVTALTVSFAAVNSVQADGALLSPRDQANQTRIMAGTGSDNLDRSLQYGTPKTRELANSPKMASGSMSTMTTVDNAGYSATCSAGLTASPKVHDTLKDTCPNFQVAPVK